MNRQKFKIWMLLTIFFITTYILTASVMADDDHRSRGFLNGKDRHGLSFSKRDDKGNETAGQIALWLLIAANLPVALSVMIKWTQRFAPVGERLKKSLGNFNRFQKNHLMFVHYYLNLSILCIATWHYLTSQCRSTMLPELGLLLMVCLISLGVVIKFKLCPKALRKNVYEIHTQPLVFISLILILTIGHTIID
jgi:hypothetical protein